MSESAGPGRRSPAGHRLLYSRRAAVAYRDLFGFAPTVQRNLLAVAVLVAASVGAHLVGLSPALPAAVGLLVLAAVRPVPGLSFAMAVFLAPLGLWLIGVQALFGDIFGREYVLSLSGAVVICTLGVVLVVTRLKLSPRLLGLAAAVGLPVAAWAAVGFAHHGVAQTLVGVRFVTLPLVMLAVVLLLRPAESRALMGVLSWLLIANGVAAVVEVIVGPARLLAWGFESNRAIRYIGDTFRAPGLTEINAELGLVSGAYLLGYVALWLTRDARPRAWSWHAAAVASVVCLGLSTSRSGGLLLAAGVVAAVLLDRSSADAARRRLRLSGLAVVAVVAAGFVAVGATGSTSTFERVQVWSGLLSSGVPWYGHGIGAVGAASFSRVAQGSQAVQTAAPDDVAPGAGIPPDDGATRSDVVPPDGDAVPLPAAVADGTGGVFVDNYFISLALQLGSPAALAVTLLLGYLLVRLWRGTADRPASVLYIAVLAGLAGTSLVVEAWEYTGAMLVLALFVGYASIFSPSARAEPPAAGAPAPSPRASASSTASPETTNGVR